MAAGRETEPVGHDLLAEQVRAWWTAALMGNALSPHPVHGEALSVRFDDDTLVLSGYVTTEEELAALHDELDIARERGISNVRIDVEIREPPGEQGLLAQTLIAIFPNEALARFAFAYVEALGRIAHEAVELILPEAEARARIAALDEPYASLVRRHLDRGRAAVLVTVDETEAFHARELLDEETRSLEVVVLPPHPRRKGAKQTISSPGKHDAVMSRPARAARSE